MIVNDELKIEFAERIAVLEERVTQLTTQSKEIDRKLGELLELRHKGVGAFWLASMLTGTGIIGSLVVALDWIKGIAS